MNSKRTLDIAIVISCATGMLLSYIYLESRMERKGSLLVLAVTGICFLILAVRDGNGGRRTEDGGR